MNIKTSSTQVRVSSSHLMARVPFGRFTFAKNLNPGDLIIAYDNSSRIMLEEKIESIQIERVETYAAPLTWHGTLLVNGILTSSYAHLNNHDLAHFGMGPVRLWWYLIHTSGLSQIGTGLSIEKQLNGTHWFPRLLETLTQHYLHHFFAFD